MTRSPRFKKKDIDIPMEGMSDNFWSSFTNLEMMQTYKWPSTFVILEIQSSL